MISAICTLFEGHYHYGVGALVNSLYRYGFRGVVWAGYRGNLPPWASLTETRNGFQDYRVAKDFILRFVPLTADHHFTNFKPDFMLRVLCDYCPEADAIFYFDPDIVIKCRWSFFEEWITYGIALCEDICSPVPDSHPLRMAWRRYYKEHGFVDTSHDDIYVNAGFIGMTRECMSFLMKWKNIQELMAPTFGGLSNANISDPTFIFKKTDQDALNISKMFSEYPLSLMGQEAMDIKFGGFTMSHAIGAPKPWKKHMIVKALRRLPPSLPDKEYWKNVRNPVTLYSKLSYLIRKADLKIAAALSRFIK